MPDNKVDVSGEGEVNDIVPAQVSRIAMRIPPFWADSVNLFFGQLESNFVLSCITKQETKFHTLISALDAGTLKHCSDLIANPPETAPYDKLKERLIEEFELSELQKIQVLLNELDVADKKPSLLLREMRELVVGRVDDCFLRNLWLSRLPAHAQAILSTGPDDLIELSRLADRVCEVWRPGATGVFHETGGFQASAVARGSEVDMLKQQVSDLSKQCQILSETMSRLAGSISEQHSHDRLGNGMLCGPNRSEGATSPKLCFYHERFGDSAFRCQRPCSYKKNA